LIIFCCKAISVGAQSNKYIGIGISYHESAVTRLTHENYLPEESTDIFSVEDLSTSGYSYSIRYGKEISSSVIFFTGIEKIRLGQNFNATTIDFGTYYSFPQNAPPGTPIFTTKTYSLELKLDYLKVPLTLYWKWMKDKPFGMFTSFSIDIGILTSATLVQDGGLIDKN